eukprot:10687061-Alexandrium_andersonii.AAC.1
MIRCTRTDAATASCESCFSLSHSLRVNTASPDASSREALACCMLLACVQLRMVWDRDRTGANRP